jgi:hypothetical protein
MHLSSQDVGFCNYLHQALALAGSVLYSAMLALSQMIVVHAAFQSTGQVIPAATVYTLIIVQLAQRMSLRLMFMNLFHLDFELHDIPPDEENHDPPTCLPRQNISFQSWTNQECYDFTSFTKVQLLNTYCTFGLGLFAAQNNGTIPVPNGGGRNHQFDPEELFLFMMTRCKTGLGNKAMCDFIFGGHAS